MDILFVDDEEGLLDQAKIFLEKIDDQLKIDTAISVDVGLQKLEKNDGYDCIISDYQMPGIDGLEFLKTIRNERSMDIPFVMFTGKGREEVAIDALNLGADRYIQKGGDPKSQYGLLSQAVVQEVEHWKREREIKQIGWLIKKEVEEVTYEPPYGDLSELNDDGLIKRSVSENSLIDITNHFMNLFMNLLDSSSAIYEKNGDYALGIFSSGWCQYLDKKSRELCDTEDNEEALKSGDWLCHESCWESSVKCMEKDEPVDIECSGGINLYAVPIKVDDKIVGAIDFGYGDPPVDNEKLKEIADKYDADFDELKNLSQKYDHRPEFIIEAAKM
ncbi:MAG: response regulator [Thermoplasmatota archaeon]